jgi:hypothetical protein
MRTREGDVTFDLLFCLSSEAGQIAAKQPAWADQLEANGMPDLAVWTAGDATVLLVHAFEQRFRWYHHPTAPYLNLMPSSHRGDPRDDNAWQGVLEHELYEGEPALPQALDLSAGALVGFDAYEPRATRLRIDVTPGEYLVVPRYRQKRLHYLSVVERALFQHWTEA